MRPLSARRTSKRTRGGAAVGAVTVWGLGNTTPDFDYSLPMDGAGEFRIFFRIVIPSIWPTLVSFILIALAGFATNQANLYSLYGDGAWTNHLSTLGYYLFELVNSGVYGGTGMYPYAAALGVFLTLIIAPITLVIRWLLNKFGPSEN